MDTKQTVNRLFNGYIGNKLFELTKLPPEEIYEYAKKDLDIGVGKNIDFTNVAIRDWFVERGSVGKEMEAAAREWLLQKGVDEIRAEIICYIFIMGVANEVISEDEVLKETILH